VTYLSPGSKPAQVADTLQDLLLISVLLAAPLVFYTHAHDVFEFNKITILRLLCALAAPLMAFKLLFVRPAKLVRSPLDLPVLAFLACALISTFHTVNFDLSLNGVYEDFEGITTVGMYVFLLWWVQQHVRSQRQINLFMSAVMIAGCFSGFYGILQNFQIDFVPWNPATYSANRLFATMGNPNFLAAYLLMSLPVTFMAFLDLPERIHVERRFTKLLIGLGAIASLFLIWLFGIHYFDFDPASYGAASFIRMLVTPKFIAAHAVVLFPLAAALLLNWGRLKMVLLVSMLFQLISIYFTKSSGGILGLGVAGALIVGFFVWEHRRGSDVLKRNRGWLIAFAALMLLSLLYPPIWQTLVETAQRMATRLNPSTITLTPRLYIWRSALQMLRDHWAFGSGLDTFQIAFPQYRSAVYWALEWNGTPEKAHNMVLQIAATMGLAGLSAFFWMLAAYVAVVWRTVRREPGTAQRMLALGGLAAVAAFLTQNLFSFTVVGYGSLFFMLMGLAPAMERAWNAERNPASEQAAPGSPSALAVGLLALLTALCIWFAAWSLRIWVADSFFKQGQVGMNVGRWDYAVVTYQKACGQVLPPKPEDFAKLLKPEPDAVKVQIVPGLNSAQELYWVKLGIAYESAAQAQEKPEDKERAYLAALTVHQLTVNQNPINGYNYNNKGRVLKSAGESLNRKDYLEAAAAHYEKAISLDPNNVYFNLDLANTYMDLEKWDQSVVICERLIQLYPDFSMPYAYAGYARMRQGKAQEAAGLLKTALAKDWKGEAQQHALSAYNLGLLLQKSGQRDEALKDFRESVGAVDNYMDGWMALARGLQQAGRRAEAADAWRRVLALQKDQPEALRSLRQLGQQP